ncbi:MAG: WYL domain-containing protein, partial [Prevotella sp.]|nr:WYL domain-containing protein [Prevotella sp.]
MATHIGCETEELKMSVSKYKDYGELKKAVCDIRQAIHEIEGKNSIEEDGNNRNKRFRYVGKSDAPLDDMLNAKVIKDLRKYWQFCQDSAGLMPQSWLDYFFEGCQDLLDINRKKKGGHQIISSSIDRILR